ncbi:MAG: 16S rRNA (uracil(1498)-N(3))-methyltransferase [Bacteroidales bacterium]|nr:16S rRNA (uracil(1498)-N(3))-methyltransferase [Bacteroidales bacterium]MBN2818297.1 16S rRNA (uracil(1498)-N(3))-methyltransferase [Bacteroidales bacterium]
MQLFYTPDISGAQYTLNETESKHCVRVLRKVKGDILHLTNGTGILYKAEITDANPKACRLAVIDDFQEFERRNYFLHIAIAPTKNIDRFEWFLEKATEIGIDEITPIYTENSERRQIKPERLEKIIVSAMKQSIKAYKPLLNKAVSFKDFINRKYAVDSMYVAHCNEGQREILKNVYQKNSSALILIGPEGDFTPEEVGQATIHGYQPVTFGNSRLRTETAGVVACHSIYLLNL